MKVKYSVQKNEIANILNIGATILEEKSVKFAQIKSS
jgi:hypothetical protein